MTEKRHVKLKSKEKRSLRWLTAGSREAKGMTQRVTAGAQRDQEINTNTLHVISSVCEGFARTLQQVFLQGTSPAWGPVNYRPCREISTVHLSLQTLAYCALHSGFG